MKKMLSILATLVLIPRLASAVIFRENEQGQMLVSKMNITQYDKDGKLNPDFRSEYEFTYDDDTDDLLEVVWTRWIKDTVHKEVLRREGDELKFEYYLDNKLQSKHTREYIFDKRDNIIKYCKITEEFDSRIGLNKFITILQYTTFLGDGMQRKIMRLIADKNVYNFTRDIRYSDFDNFYTKVPETPGVLELNFNFNGDNKLGFKRAVNYLISDDDIMYLVSDHKNEHYYIFNGNLVEIITNDLAKLTTNKNAVRQEYTDIENPTNINILPLAYQNHRSELCMDKFIETVTPWYPFKSKFLPLKDDMTIYEKTFDYEINNKGQLEQMTISSYEGMPYSTVVEFDYECDFSGWEPLEEDE